MTYQIDEIRLSHSTQSGLLATCKRKFEFVKMFQHSDRDESLPGEVGNCLHAGYQDYLLNKDREQALYKMMLKYPFHLNKDPQDHRSVEACYATMNTMIDSGLFLEYELAYIKCLDGETRPAIEVPFEIKFKDQYIVLKDGRVIPVRYVGFVDLILYDKMEDEYVIIDIKTTRNLLKDYTTVYMFDEQCLAEAIVLERILGHKLNNIRVKYMVVYVDIEKPFIRSLDFWKDRQDIEDWARKELFLIKELSFCASQEWFPREPKSCVNFRRECSFKDICGHRNVKFIQENILQDEEPYINPFPDPWIALELELEAA